jgi:hypothetical protein
MVVHESFVTRKPLEFTIIVLFIVFLLLLPVYFYTKQHKASEARQVVPVVTDTYGEVNYLFGPDSDLSDSDKKNLFKMNYENRFVQWIGTLLACDPLGNGMFRASVDHTGGGMGDVLFTTFKDCTGIPIGSTVTYKTMLIEWKIRSFIGKEGEILTWA